MTGYEIAKTKLGLHENKDTADLDRYIAKYVSAWKGLHVNTTAWCAAFVNACEREAGNKGTGLLNARSFLTYGMPVKLEQAQPGDIVVFSRGGSTWQGHVAYYDGIEISNGRTLIRTIGGNQSDSVSRGWYGSERLIGIRRP